MRVMAMQRSPAKAPEAHPILTLMVVLFAAYVINLDTTIVNVALPSLDRELNTTTEGLQWIVDGYNLAFAALVLLGGNLGDRLGRRKVLMLGLAMFAIASGVSALATSAAELIALRFVAGAGAALIFPTTLSIISNTFLDRASRARAIGLWGAVTGLGVATGPVVGGALLKHYAWGSIFVALVPIAVVTIAGAALVVKETRDPHAPPADRTGLVLSVASVGLLVYSVIEAPTQGWLTPRTILMVSTALLLLAVFARYELNQEQPMLDARLFANMRFTAACGAVTIAFFALAGFIFLVTQFFQVLRGYEPFESGVRMLPVAGSIAVTSMLGTWLATKIGNKVVVTSGLLLLVGAYGWIATVQIDTTYMTIVGQMVMLGSGLGLTAAPATEAIMSVVRPEQAGAGSAVNDATRELGGTLGVAVLGSIFASLYSANITPEKVPGLPADLAKAARASLGGGEQVLQQSTQSQSLPANTIAALQEHISNGFMNGFHAACIAASCVCLAAAILVAIFLPAFGRNATEDEVRPSPLALVPIGSAT